MSRLPASTTVHSKEVHLFQFVNVNSLHTSHMLKVMLNVPNAILNWIYLQENWQQTYNLNKTRYDSSDGKMCGRAQVNFPGRQSDVDA